MGAELRDHRRPPPGLARVQADVQRTVDAGEVRLSESSPSATRFRRAGRGRVEVITFKPLSKNPGALHAGDHPRSSGSDWSMRRALSAGEWFRAVVYLALMGTGLDAPDHTTLSRRSQHRQTLALTSESRRTTACISSSISRRLSIVGEGVVGRRQTRPPWDARLDRSSVSNRRPSRARSTQEALTECDGG